jgi:hypothetical protein
MWHKVLNCYVTQGKKGKVIPATGRGNPQGCEMNRSYMLMEHVMREAANSLEKKKPTTLHGVAC